VFCISPQICNLESGDAFCLLELSTDRFTLIVLQVTVGKKHPIKANGLKHIVEAFPLRTRIVRKAIVFVTPAEGELCTVQHIVSQDNKISSRIPEEASNFEQWVYRHKIASNPTSG
jgi:hypothetical protein